MPTIENNGKNFEVDEEGYLMKPEKWCADFARAAAGFKLTDTHWRVINFLRGTRVESEGKDITAIRESFAEWIGGAWTGPRYARGLFRNGPSIAACMWAGFANPSPVNKETNSFEAFQGCPGCH